MSPPPPQGLVLGLAKMPEHGFSKPTCTSLELQPGLGVVGDVHAGATVQHLYNMKRDPTEENLRQVHLVPVELHEQLAEEEGFKLIAPGGMGDNITTRGVDLLGLPTGTRLHLGDAAVVELTGLRSPCAKLNSLQPGLMAALMRKGPDGKCVLRSGVMGVVAAAGTVSQGDSIRVELPAEPHRALAPV